MASLLWRVPFCCLLLAITAAPAAGEEILVFAAASTTEAMQEIGRQFEGETGNRVDFSFASSATLARQILAGAPANVFLSADLETMRRLEQAGLVRPADVRNLLSDRLVVIVPSGSSLKIAAPRDLTQAATIATGDPKSVPLGLYAHDWLQSARLWDALAPRIVPALDARAALAAVETGAADAGIVYETDAVTTGRVRVVYAVPRGDGPLITYAVARVNSSKKGAANAFVDFLSGEKARSVFLRAGFVLL